MAIGALHSSNIYSVHRGVGTLIEVKARTDLNYNLYDSLFEVPRNGLRFENKN